MAVRDNSADIVEVLLSFGADPLRPDPRGNTCLHAAVEVRAWASLRALLDAGLRHRDEVDAKNSINGES